jgi:AAHS family 4-hydroxybenzoate transporter-like MFS transporter
MHSDTRIDVMKIIDNNRIGAYQWGILLLCGLCMILDGFDVQAMGYVAPALLQDWKVDKAALGPVFGAGLFGLLVGSLFISVLADKFGRRPVLIASTFFFAICMIATPLTSNLQELMVMRFITGLGLGAIMPNAMALTGEFSPQRKRISVMMMVSCGFTVGAMLGGLVAAAIIPRFGWQAVFYAGGFTPLLIGMAMLKFLPESIQYQVLNRAPKDRIASVLARVAPGTAISSQATFQVPEKKEDGVPVARLFSEGRAWTTVTLWAISFLNLIALYFLSNWLPTLAKSAGLSLENAVLLGAMLQFGGTVGTISMGWVIDKLGFRPVLLVCFTVAACFIALIGHAAASTVLLFAVVFITGFAVVGGQPAINAMAASFYPTTLRSTGIGWCLGIGRVGSVIGPVVGGELIRLNWGQADLFHAVAVPSVLIVVMLIVGIRGAATQPSLTANAVAH